mgnify:CR=1 FL=1
MVRIVKKLVCIVSLELVSAREVGRSDSDHSSSALAKFDVGGSLPIGCPLRLTSATFSKALKGWTHTEYTVDCATGWGQVAARRMPSIDGLAVATCSRGASAITTIAP